MINHRLFREDLTLIKQNLARRRSLDSFQPDEIAAWYHTLGQLQPRGDELRNERNQLNKIIGNKRKLKENADAEMDRMRFLSEEIRSIDSAVKELTEKSDREILSYPNILQPDVPDGNDERENVEIRTSGKIPDFSFQPLTHEDLGEKWQLFDMAAGSKITGTKFPVYKGVGALLERAIVNFMLDTHTRENGYQETFVPMLVNDESMIGTGQYPKFMDEYYRLDKDGLSLIPTAEVPLTNLYRDEIIPIQNLPQKITAYSSCFRREAGSYGKETRGLVRVHQFQKVELVKICTPESSAQEHEALLADAESILQKLKLPYRVMLLCSGDTSAASSKTFDLEVWMPGLNRYLEISSVSNFTDFQARRARIRLRRDAQEKPELAHTLNGSGLAAGRTMAAILENYQQADGTIHLPDVLRPYMGGLEAIR